MIRNVKLNAENIPIKYPLLPGTYELYFLYVIRLARDDISVPTPPMFTPTRRSA